MLTFTFKKLPRWNRWVRQFSYIFKVRNRNEGLAASLRVSYCICNFKDVAFTDDSRFTDARTPLSHSLLSHTITIAQLSTLVSDATLISSTDSRLSDARTPAHNHITLTGVTSISFATDPSDSASISTTINANGTYFDFNLTDDNNNDWWRWRFTPSGSVVYDAMTLKPVANGFQI
jgi:hypothetical protein